MTDVTYLRQLLKNFGHDVLERCDKDNPDWEQELEEVMDEHVKIVSSNLMQDECVCDCE